MDLYQHLPDDTLIRLPDPAPTRLTVRSVLQADAILGIGSGAALVIAGGWLATAADLASATPLRAIGVFLLVYGAGLAWASRQPVAVARQVAVITGFGDLSWVSASVAVALVVDLPMWAIALILAQAAIVAAMAAAKFHVTS